MGGDFINAPLDMFDHKIDPDLLVECSVAARRNLRLGRHIYDGCADNSRDGSPHESAKLIMMDLHHIFNAAVILLLHQMVYSNVVNTDTLSILAAKRIFDHEARTECASPGTQSGGGGAASGVATGYASDCLGVLNDLAALVAHIRPLRFRGTQHVSTGVSVGGYERVPVNTTDLSAGNVGGNGPSEEQLAANLGLVNPYGPETWCDDHLMMAANEPHTNQKEMERWVQECREGLAGPFLRYTGM